MRTLTFILAFAIQVMFQTQATAQNLSVDGVNKWNGIELEDFVFFYKSREFVKTGISESGEFEYSYKVTPEGGEIASEIVTNENKKIKSIATISRATFGEWAALENKFMGYLGPPDQIKNDFKIWVGETNILMLRYDKPKRSGVAVLMLY